MGKNKTPNAGSLDPVVLRDLAKNPKLMEVGRKAIEDVLAEWRDMRTSEFTRGNGLVIREKDGSESSIIRMGSEVAVSIALKAIADHIEKAQNDPDQRPAHGDAGKPETL